jgi:hypothetical protein
MLADNTFDSNLSARLFCCRSPGISLVLAQPRPLSFHGNDHRRHRYQTDEPKPLRRRYQQVNATCRRKFGYAGYVGYAQMGGEGAPPAMAFGDMRCL